MLRSFKYVLEPVLTKNRWELDNLSNELALARKHLAECTGAVEQLRSALASLWREFEQVRGSAALLDVGKESSLRHYAERLTAQLQQKLTAQSEAQQTHDQIATGLRRSLQEVRGMENHRERQQLSHAAESHALQIKQADDDWLTANPPGGRAA